jgi:hypothetical protein
VLPDRDGLRLSVGLAIACGPGCGFWVGGGQGLILLAAGSLQQRRDLTIDPTKIDQQYLTELLHLLALAAQRRPFLVGLSANLLGELPCLPQRLLGLAGHLGADLLGLADGDRG